MLYILVRILSILFLLAINISINLLWFKISAVLGIAILLAISFVVYKTISFALQERKAKNNFQYEILNHTN
ncbi:MAG TPA: hypothetical protein VD794_05660 [Flavisolibacter sp.]|nr:hypothetical protein [Flavisolibacter sp.]